MAVIACRQGRPRLAGGLAASVLVHCALLVALTWHAAAPKRAARPMPEGRVTTVWLTASAAPAADRAPVPVAPAAPKAVRRAAPIQKVEPPNPVALPEPPPPAAEPISGAVFGLPTIASGSGGGTRWMRPRDEAAAPAVPMAPPPQWQAQAMREAGRAQFAQALQQRLERLPAPADASDGRCALRDDAQEAPLGCDSEALQQAVQADAHALAGLLRAYRGLDARVSIVAVVYTRGGYAFEMR